MDIYNSILVAAKNQQKKGVFWEALLLFLVFFFPGYLYQSTRFDFQVMYSPAFHISNLIFTLPQVLLLLYILHLRTEGRLEKYGVHPFRLSLLPAALLSFLGILAITAMLSLTVQLIGSTAGVELTNPALPNMSGSQIDYSVLFKLPYIPICILGTCLLTGYFEELYFRTYLLTEFADSPVGTAGIVLISSFLFAIGHLYQGLIGFFGTFLLGTFLAYRYLRRRSWHEIAIAHGLYNFLMIMLIPAVH